MVSYLDVCRGGWDVDETISLAGSILWESENNFLLQLIYKFEVLFEHFLNFSFP